MFDPGEGGWVGWKRKRGKLHELNRLLRGAADTTFMGAQVPEAVRYVITLDADTRLGSFRPCQGVVHALYRDREVLSGSRHSGRSAVPHVGRSMSKTDVFALDRSGFNGFLFESIGTEANGQPLTVLSALARLGEDPWLRAANWARMSRTAAGEALAALIAKMPVTAEDLRAAPSTAARLVLLLSPASPVPSQVSGPVESKIRPRLAGVVLSLVTLLTLLGAVALWATHF